MNGACNRLGGGHRCLQILGLLLRAAPQGRNLPEQTGAAAASVAPAGSGGSLRWFHIKTENSQVEQNELTVTDSNRIAQFE